MDLNLDDFSFSRAPDELADTWLAATNFGGSDGSWVTPRTSDTVPSNALQSMQPVTAANDAGGWSDFWKGALQTVVGYSIQKDAVQSGVARPVGQVAQPGQIGQQYGPQYVGQQNPMGGMMPLIMIGGLALLLSKTLK